MHHDTIQSNDNNTTTKIICKMSSAKFELFVNFIAYFLALYKKLIVAWLQMKQSKVCFKLIRSTIENHRLDILDRIVATLIKLKQYTDEYKIRVHTEFTDSIKNLWEF
uniref:Uncharacterized protein n=1 Tax=Glossina brevipalpis TaxID=37001 RepID=A0A1A9WMY7_9MUSC